MECTSSSVISVARGVRTAELGIHSCRIAGDARPVAKRLSDIAAAVGILDGQA